MITSINVVPEEQVVCLWGKPSVLKQPQQVCVLSMNIT